MKTVKTFILMGLALMLISIGASAQAKRKKVFKKTPVRKTKPVSKSVPKPPVDVAGKNNEFRVLVEGSYSKVETPFVFIARDAETYALLRSLVEGLPASSTVDFSKTAVVAAFAGTKSTGGYAAVIRRAADKFVVEVSEPDKGDMRAQVITTPFQVAVVPVSDVEAVPLELTATWTGSMENYRVSKGSFAYSGGIAGRTQKFEADGTVGVLKHGEHITYNFNLSGKGASQGLKLSEMTSGIINAGKVEIARLDTGTFAETPRPALKVSGTANATKLLLTFESHPPTVADGYEAEGKLEAVRIK